jgi:6,7-dimethyl-8-ribityllumazine synthase
MVARSEEGTTGRGGRDTRRVAFVQSSWHSELVDQSRQSFLAEIAALGVATDRVDTFRVPGAFEIPLHAKRLALTGNYVAIVGAALVVDGGIYRHEFVAQAVINGLMQVQLQTDVPVISVVLSPHHFHEHEVHQAFFLEHLRVKGREAAQACANTVDALERIELMTVA